MQVRTTPFDAVDYLDSEERRRAYIVAALEIGDANFIRDAHALVARARALSQRGQSAD